MSKTQQKSIFTTGTGLKWMSLSHPASWENSPARADSFLDEIF